MDWTAITFDWNRARAFLVTAEEGSLSAAARALGLAQPTLGRQVTALEQDLGVALFARTGRGLTLTEAGLSLLEHVRAMGEAANRVALTAGGQAQSLEGQITITASEIYAGTLLPPVLQKLAAIAPGLRVEIVASNSAVNLRRREADIAIRNTAPTEPDLIGRKIGSDRARLYATPDYLRSIGAPASPNALAKHARFLAFDAGSGMVKALNAIGVAVTMESFPVVCSNHLVYWELLRSGAGVGAVSELLGEPDPRVVRALPDLPAIPFGTWLITHEELRLSRRIRTVFDLIAEEVSARLSPPSG